ncbi:hypothetical protein [Simplicispira piscis]
MSNITHLRQTRRVTIPAHRVTFDLVPRAVVEELFFAAVAVGFAADEGAYSAHDANAQERLDGLHAAATKAAQYTVPVEIEVDEPIHSGDIS